MSITVPGYWMHETSGVLRPVVTRYLAGAELHEGELGIMRAYLDQWMGALWLGRSVEDLRERIPQINTTAELREWLLDALDAGIDPL